jgi:hypothetical protein
LEAQQTLRTPPEEREKREKMTTTNVENIKSLEEECSKIYEERTKLWNQLIKYVGKRYRFRRTRHRILRK